MGSQTDINTFAKWTKSEMELSEKFCDAKDSVHTALCGTFTANFVLYIFIYYLHVIFKRYFVADNIDTRSALDAIRDLVSHCNIYIKQVKQPNTLFLRDVAVYITKIFTIFGAISSSHDAIGFPVDDTSTNLNVCFVAFSVLYMYTDRYCQIEFYFILLARRNCYAVS